MKEYHITIKGGRWLLVGLGVLVFGLALITAGAIYLFLTVDPLKMVNIRVRLEQQHIKARMAGSFPVVADVDQTLRLPLKKTISVSLPFNQHLAIPFNKTLDVPVEIDTIIPIDITVPFKSEIPVDTEILLDTEVETVFMGFPVKVPVKGKIPVHTTISVNQDVAVREGFHLKMRSPVKVEVKDNFEIPINLVFSADIPLDTVINIPLKDQILASVSLENETTTQLPNLYLLDSTLDVKIEQLDLVGREKP